MSHQVGFALSSQCTPPRITLHSLAQANAQSGPALVHSEGHWPGRQHPPGFTVAAVGLCRLVHLCVVSEHRDFKSLFRGKDDWNESLSWLLFSAFDVDVQNSCSVFKWTVWCWRMKVDLCCYTKDILLCGVSQLSEEVLQKDNCPSFFEPCKITLLECIDVCMCIYPFFCPILTAVCGKNVTHLQPTTVQALGCKIYLIHNPCVMSCNLYTIWIRGLLPALSVIVSLHKIKYIKRFSSK